MNTAYYRTPGTPSRIMVVRIEDVIGNRRAGISYEGKLFCPACGEQLHYSNGGESMRNGKRFYRGPYFKHQAKGLCTIDECENRVDRQINDGRYISQKLKLPLFLRPNKSGAFVLSAGFSTANKEALRKLKNRGFSKVVGTLGTSVPITISLDDLLDEKNSDILFLDLDAPVLKGMNVKFDVEGAFIPPISLSEGNEDWSDNLDSFTDQSGAVFQYSAGNAGEKVSTGSSILAGRPYLIAQKDTARGSIFIKPYLQNMAEKYGFLYEKKGYLNFQKQQCYYTIHKVVFPESQKMANQDYQDLLEKLREQFGVFLCDTVSETRPLWPPATRKADAYGVQVYQDPSVMLIGEGVTEKTVLYQHRDYETTDEVRFSQCNGVMVAKIPLLTRRTPVSFGETFSGSVVSYRRDTLKESEHEVLLLLSGEETPIRMHQSGHYDLERGGDIQLTAPCPYAVYRSGTATEYEPGEPVSMTVRTGEHFVIQTCAGLIFDISVKGNEQDEPARFERYVRYLNRNEKERKQ